MKPVVFFCSLILLVMLAGCKSRTVYQAYAIRYADGYVIPAAGSVTGADSTDSVDVCDMFWLLQDNKGRNILVDAGFIDSSGRIPNFIRPDLALAPLGLEAGDITDIIITHPHIDHVGGLSLFPQARLWMNDEDYQYFTVTAWEEGGNSFGLAEQDAEYLRRAYDEGRVTLISGDSVEFMPGITAFTGSKHTWENIWLLVSSDTKEGKILLASDAVWFYLNLDKELPASVVFDPEAYVSAMKRMKTMVDDQALIIPGHDDSLFVRFPAVAEGIVRLSGE
ncbi:MAG: N-acyl homoserine lactonase family protein [Bacteroidota bacterium]